jgi:hypothetical protein
MRYFKLGSEAWARLTNSTDDINIRRDSCLFVFGILASDDFVCYSEGDGEKHGT